MRNSLRSDCKPKQYVNPAAMSAAVAGDLENFIVASTPGGIEAQEARGQQTFVNSAALPIKGTSGESRKTWEIMGVTFGENDDDLFVNVTLPAGWKKVASDHSMWSHLVDEQGRKRAAIFYKAAFYDRSAHVVLTRRYSVDAYADEGCVVKDGEKVINTFGKPTTYDERNAARKNAEAWLSQNYPGWESPTALW